MSLPFTTLGTSGPLAALSKGLSLGGLRDPSHDLSLCILRQSDDLPDLLNYQTRLSDGRLLRSSTLFIRDGLGHVLGRLCLNRDMTHRIQERKPVNLMDKADKVHVVRALDARGIFIKGAVEAVACAPQRLMIYDLQLPRKGAGSKRNPHYLLRAIVGKTGEEVIATDTYMTRRSPSAHFSINIQKEEH